MKTLSIIIPVYNESKTITTLLQKVLQAQISMNREIILVNDGSLDESLLLMKQWKAGLSSEDQQKVKILSKTNGGKGSAVRLGVSHSSGEVIIIQDADLEYDPEDYQKCIEPILQGKAKIVYGSRERLSENRLHSSLSFYLGGLAITYWINFWFGSSLTDAPTCYKTFEGSLLRQLLFQGDGFDWEPEITAKLLRLGYAIYEVPISYFPRKVQEGKKITWRDGLIAFYVALLWRFKPVGAERKKLEQLESERPRFIREKREKKKLFFLVLFCFLVRILCAFPGFSNPKEAFFRPDSPTYVQPAIALLETGSYLQSLEEKTPATLRPPLYSVFLAFLFALSPPQNLVWPVVGFCLLSACCCIPIFYTGCLFGSSSVGFLAAFLYSLNITSIAAAPMYLSDTLFLFFVSGQLYFFTRFYFTERILDLWFAVALSGWATLIRPVGLLWIVPVVFLILIFPRKSVKKRLFSVLTVCLLYGLIVAPWFLRNHGVSAGYVLDTNMGRTLYHHNCAALLSVATGESADVLRERWQREEQQLFDSDREQYRTPKSQNEYRLKQARAVIWQYPLLYIRLHFQLAILLPDAPTFFEILGLTQSGRGTLDVLNRKGIWPAVSHYFEGNFWLLFVILPLLFLVILTYLGSFWQLCSWIFQKQIFLFFFFLAFVAYYLILPGPIAMPRYQLPALPLLTVMAALKWVKISKFKRECCN